MYIIFICLYHIIHGVFLSSLTVSDPNRELLWCVDCPDGKRSLITIEHLPGHLGPSRFCQGVLSRGLDLSAGVSHQTRGLESLFTASYADYSLVG